MNDFLLATGACKLLFRNSRRHNSECTFSSNCVRTIHTNCGPEMKGPIFIFRMIAFSSFTVNFLVAHNGVYLQCYLAYQPLNVQRRVRGATRGITTKHKQTRVLCTFFGLHAINTFSLGRIWTCSMWRMRLIPSIDVHTKFLTNRIGNNSIITRYILDNRTTIDYW